MSELRTRMITGAAALCFAAAGVVELQAIAHAMPLLCSGDTNDVTAMLTGQMQRINQLSLNLAMLGEHVAEVLRAIGV